jgi:hypothetical protein
MKHPNNVIEHGDWTVVRGESATVDIECGILEPKVFRYYYTYHEHQHERNSSFCIMNRVQLNDYAQRVKKLQCECGKPVPDEVLGALILIAWSDEDAIIR